MSAAIAHTSRAPHKCWDENQYSLLYAAIKPNIYSGRSLVTVVQEAMEKVIDPAEHRNITATVAKQAWKKAQLAVGITPTSSQAGTMPAPMVAPAPAVISTITPSPGGLVKMTVDQVVEFRSLLRPGTKIEIIA